MTRGKKYTESSEKLAYWWNGYSIPDDIREWLCRKDGWYFLSGESNCKKYIKTLTEEEAKQWVEDCANDKYEEIFGEVEEG